MARGDAVGQWGPGDAAGEDPVPEAAARPQRRPSDDDALHPMRHLRRDLMGYPAEPLQRFALSAEMAECESGGTGTEAPAKLIAESLDDAGGSGRASRRWRRSPSQWSRRTNLMAVLGLAAVVAGGSSAVALLAQGHPPSPISPLAGPLSNAPAVFGSAAASAIPAVPAAEGIGDLRMFSTSTGWAQRLTDGAVLHTTQGVQRWTIASPPAGQILAVAYVDPEVARALTTPSGASAQTTVQAWGTEDGGATWSAGGAFDVRGFNASIGGVLDFVDAETGWFSQFEAAEGVSGSALYRTVDGGAHWSEVAAMSDSTLGAGPAGILPGGCVALTAAFVSDSTGWLTGTCAAGSPPLYVTHDGGQTWAVAPLHPLPKGSDEETSFPPTFTSQESGALLTENETEAGPTTSLFATTDGGISWLLRSTKAGAPLATAVVGADDGWLVTDGDGTAGAPDLYATGDGGSTWTHLDAFPFVGLSLDFLTPDVGWAAPDLRELDGGPTYVVQTVDGGRTWTAVLPQLDSPAPSP